MDNIGQLMFASVPPPRPAAPLSAHPASSSSAGMQSTAPCMRFLSVPAASDNNTALRLMDAYGENVVLDEKI
jgi:hypothetical protein